MSKTKTKRELLIERADKLISSIKDLKSEEKYLQCNSTTEEDLNKMVLVVKKLHLIKIALNLSSEFTQSVISLKYLEGYSNSEISKALGSTNSRKNSAGNTMIKNALLEFIKQYEYYKLYTGNADLD
ncbi:MAG: hypothetical protein ACRDD7_11075 [Peptostreptococcaceae bacterium]